MYFGLILSQQYCNF